MRVLSIQQPWAWLIVNGYKDIENRDWPTRVRGEIAIHAGKKFDEGAYRWVARHFPELRLPWPQDLPIGGVVGTARVVDCVSHHESRWFMGDYGFVLADAKPCDLIPLRGQLGFFAADLPTLAPSRSSSSTPQAPDAATVQSAVQSDEAKSRSDNSLYGRSSSATSPETETDNAN